MTETNREIIAIEREMFDCVQNPGGRTPCQDDSQMFSAMRDSQLSAWNDDMCLSYLADLQAAQREGRNLFVEKYGYMMKLMNPEEYTGMQEKLPPHSMERDWLIDWISKAQVVWQEALAATYPYLVGNGRNIRKSEGNSQVASLESYLCGELSTYSVQTLRLYAAYVERLQKAGDNLNEMILRNMVAVYGYSSLGAAEARLSGKQTVVVKQED